MSFQAMAWATEQEVPAMQKIVLLMLANRTNHDTGQCTPSHERLAKDCGMSVRSCKDQLAKLASAGLIEVLRRSKEGISLPNQYILAMHKPRGQDLPTRGRDLPNRGQDAPEGGAADAGGVGQQVPTKQEVEPVIEPISMYVAPRVGKFSPIAFLLQAGVDAEHAADWLQVREDKGSSSTKSSIGKILTKFAEAGMSAADGVRVCADNSWAGFDKSWLANKKQTARTPAAKPSRHSGFDSLNYSEGVSADGHIN